MHKMHPDAGRDPDGTRSRCPHVYCGRPVKLNRNGHRMGWCEKHWPKRRTCDECEWQPCKHAIEEGLR